MKKLKKTIRFGFRSMLLLVLAGVLGGQCDFSPSGRPNAEKVKAAPQGHAEEAASLGEPKAEGSGLFFGTTKMNGNYTIVDALKGAVQLHRHVLYEKSYGLRPDQHERLE